MRDFDIYLTGNPESEGFSLFFPRSKVKVENVKNKDKDQRRKLSDEDRSTIPTGNDEVVKRDSASHCGPQGSSTAIHWTPVRMRTLGPCPRQNELEGTLGFGSIDLYFSKASRRF